MIEHSRDKTVSYYYDSHPTEEDLMGETTLHHVSIVYLEEVLKWLFRGQICSVQVNLNFYVTNDEMEYPIAPDIAVIKGVPYRDEISWRVGITGPAPQVVFEFASDKTWKRDLDEKPLTYAQMGVLEYYAFDPYDPPLPLSRRKGGRLFGWQRNAITRPLQKVLPELDGRLWSPQLRSWLKADGKYLRLYDLLWNRRLTEIEVETAVRQAEAERAEREAARATREAASAQAAIQQLQVEAARAQALAEKLRALGIDPDQPL